MSAPFAVIGIGNSLRGDDGAGAAVIDALRDRVDPDRVELFTCHQLLPEFAPTLRDRRGVIFVDASVDLEPGRVRSRVLHRDPDPWRWGHRLGASALLGMVEAEIPPPAHSIEIGAESFEYGMTFSPPVSTAIGVARDTVLATLHSLGAMPTDAVPARARHES